MSESYYSAAQASAQPPSFNTAGPPPPPPPKPSSHDPSRAGTPITPQNYAHTQVQGQPNPPQIPPSSSHAHALAKQQQQQQQQHHQQQQHQAPQPQPLSPHHMYRPVSAVGPPPVDSGWLPEGFSAKPIADLQPLLNDPALLTALARQHPAYKTSLDPLQGAVSTNLALAQQVGQLENQVRQLREQTGQLLINHTSLQTQWKRKESEMNDALSPWESRAMYQRLVSSISEQESLLRAVHESFLEEGSHDGGYSKTEQGKATEREVTEWIKRIREGTTTLEKRREMRARWDEGRVGGLR